MGNQKRACQIISFVVIFVLGLFFSVSNGLAADDKEMIFKRPLKFASWFSTAHMVPPFENELCKNLEAASNGRVKIQFYGAQSLGKVLEQYEMVLDNVSDIGGGIPVAYEADKLPLTSFMEFPFIWKSAVVGTKVFYRLYEKGYFNDEYKDFKMLAYYSCAVNQLYTAKKRIDKLEDFKGLKFFVGSPMHYAMYKQLGAIPIRMGYPDTYTALQRGTLDGSIGPLYSMVKGWRYPEVVKYAWQWDISGGFAIINAVNKDVWNKLPADIQTAWEKAGRDISFKIAEEYDAKVEEGTALWKASKSELVKISKEEIDRMAEKFLPLWQKWVDDNEAKGRPAKKLYKAYVEIMKEMGQPVIMRLPGLYEN